MFLKSPILIALFVFAVLANLYVVSRPLLASPEKKIFTAKAYILCYHTFLGKPSVFTDFSISEFSEQISTLKKNGFRFITLKQLEAKQYEGSKNVLIILDDGNKTSYQAYKNVLKPLNIKPVFAIYPNVIGKVHYAMTWDQLKEVQKEGCEVSSHGYFHLYLKSEFAQKDPKGFAKEIVTSKKVLEEKLGISVPYFVYPFGVLSPEAKTLLKQSGYRYAFSLKAKPVEIEKEDYYDMPRYMLTRSTAKSIMSTLLNTL